jgi:hypothetical protein
MGGALSRVSEWHGQRAERFVLRQRVWQTCHVSTRAPHPDQPYRVPAEILRQGVWLACRAGLIDRAVERCRGHGA